MTFWDKIMFWKKDEEPIPETPSSGEDDFSFDENLDKPFDNDFGNQQQEPMGLDHEAPNIPSKPTIPLGQPMRHQTGGMDRDTELILAKLDAVKAKMESIDARLAHIEKLAEE